MGMSWKLGRIAGIDVFLHATFVLLLAYVGMTEGEIGPILLVCAVFGCVLLHELGHALMARRFGIATVDITLYPIGGVARLRRMPRAPGAELLIALAGPAVNVLIVLGLIILGLIGVRGEFLETLLLINVMLALFNLIPAFPMDGGRVLRALLSGWLGRARATMIAAGIGRGLALVFGIYCLTQGSLLQAMLAAFIYFAAGLELNHVLAEEQHERLGQRWGRDPAANEGIWAAPAGYRWVSQGNGTWQLAPIVATGGEPFARPWS
jgi:Zn-dependent protease